MTPGGLRRLEVRTLLPLVAAYLILTTLYGWQACQRQTPTLFSDEIEFTQISRSVADTGRATLRGGEPAPGASLYAYLTAPAWWLDRVELAYGAIKFLGVLLMTSALFAAYALARLVVSRPYALFAAVATGAAPALSYAPFLVEEPLAYPVATLALYLIARAGIDPTPRSIGLALAASIVGALVRGQLAVLLPVLLLTLLVREWNGPRQRRWRATWSTGDRVGALVLAVGIALIASAAVGRRSNTWYVATAFLKERMLEYGLWAAGALAIGVGVLPLVAALAMLVRSSGESADPRFSAFRALSVAALVSFGFYAALKAAYLSVTLSVVVAERNLIYLYPLLFVGTALLLERRRASALGIGAAAAFALYLVTTTPYTLEQYPNYEAHGLAIAALANRILIWPDETIQAGLVVLTLASAAVLLALRLVRGARGGAAVVGALAAFVLAWSLTTEIYAANGEQRESARVYANLPKPPDWVDRTTRGKPTIFVGQGIDSFAAWQLEFWNPNVRWFWGMDGTAPGPGERRTPNLIRPDGTQDPADLYASYAVAVNGVELAAPRVTQVGTAVLYRLDGQPVRLAHTATGVAPDGWMARSATYTQYDVDPGVRGFLKVTFSRQGACFPQLERVRVSVAVGPVVVDANDQPAIREATARREGMLAPCQITPLVVRVPPGPWRAEAAVDSVFVPNELDERLGDRRELGAVVSFELISL